MHDRRARWLCVLAACALALVVQLAAGCGGSGSHDTTATTAARRAPRKPPVDPAVQAKLMRTGARLFEQHCHACHTLGGKKHTGPIIEVEAPNLDDVKPLASYVEQRVHSGGFDMASFDGVLSPAQIRAVVTYVTTASGRNATIPETGQDEFAIGQGLFRDHCQMCHQLAGRVATGRPAYPGTNFDAVRPSERRVIRQALRGIPEEMPSFRGKLTNSELHALAAYVASTAGRGR